MPTAFGDMGSDAPVVAIAAPSSLSDGYTDFDTLFLELLHLTLQLRTASEHSFPLRPRRNQFFPLQFDDVTSLSDAPFSFSHSTFELCTGHLRISQLLSP